MSGAINMGSHQINFLTDPTSAQDAATKAYVDATAQGLTIQGACRVATTGALTVTYNNVSVSPSGVGATLTNAGAQAAIVIDGVTLSVNDRVLVKNQAAALPTWSTTTYPSTNAINTLLYASSANVMSALATVNSAFLKTSSGGVPTWNSTLPINKVTTQLITTTGAYTYTPTAGTLFAIFELQAGGGGSGGTTGAGASSACGGAGAGGAYMRVLVSGATNLAGVSGSGGVGGAARTSGYNAGGHGGNTTLIVNSGSTWAAGGGAGGGRTTAGCSG